MSDKSFEIVCDNDMHLLICRGCLAGLPVDMTTPALPQIATFHQQHAGCALDVAQP